MSSSQQFGGSPDIRDLRGSLGIDQSRLRYAIFLVLLAAAYFAAAKFGLSLASVHTNVSPVWPPTGIAIAAVLLFGYRAWPAILIGAFAGNYLTPVTLPTAIAIAIGNTLEAVIAAAVLKSTGFHPSFDRARDVFKFVAVVLLCATVSATIGNLSLVLGHSATWRAFPSLWLTWWLGDLTGAVTVTPLVLTWLSGRGHWLPKRRYFEATALIILLSASAIATFGGKSPAPVHYYPLTRLMIPFLLWAAFRLGRRGVTVAVAVISAFAIWGTWTGNGPFASGDPNDSLLMLQLFIASNAVTFLALVTVVEERAIAERRRHEDRERLQANLAVTRILAESPETNVALQRILATVGEMLGWEFGCVWVPTTEAKFLSCAAVWKSGSKAPEFEALCRGREFEKGIGLPGRVWADLKPAWIQDVAKDDNFPRAQTAIREGLHAAFAFPILENERLLGVVEFFSSEIRQPDEPLLAMFAGIGGQIGQFMERKRAETAVESASLLPKENPSPVIRLSENGIVTYANPAAEPVLRAWGASIGEEAPSIFTETARRVLAAGERDTLEISTGDRSYSIEVAPVASAHYVNLYFNDITERNRMERSLAEFARRQSALFNFANKLQDADSLPEIYTAGLDAILAAIQCDRASLLLFDEHKVMRFAGWRGLSDEYRATVEGHSPWEPTDLSPEPISIASIAEADLPADLKTTILNEGIHASAFIPLVSGGRLIGKFMAYYNSVHEFSAEEIDLSLTLARHLANAIEIKRAESALRDSEQRYRSVIEALPAAVYTTDAEGRITMFNQAAVELSGRVPEVGNDSWCVTWKLYYPDGTPMPHEECPMALALKEGKPNRGHEAIAERPDGSRVNFIPYPTPLRDSSGKLIGAINMLVDITERKRTEIALEKSERELNEFFENATEAIHWVGPDGTILRANKAELRMLGYSAAEYIGRNIAEFHVDKAGINSIIEKLHRGETLNACPAQMIAKDGSIRDVLINSSVYFEDGRFVHTRCFTRDVTERLRTEKALRHLAAIVETTDDAVISKDLNGVITSWNPAAERLYGYKAEEVVGKPITILIPPERPDEEPAILEKLRKGQQIDHYETIRVAKSGRRINVSLTVSPIFDANGKVIGASKIARDITQKKQAQDEIARLLAAERAARQDAEVASRAKDEFLAVLSHELRTPLTAMLGWLSILRGHRLDEKTTEHAIETIERNAKAQAQLIEDLVDISRIVGGRLNLEVSPIELLPVIKAAIEVVRPAADAKDIKIEVNSDLHVGPVFGDPARMQQIIWNLLSNAVKFTPKSGSVQVDFRRYQSYAQVVVRDSGIGIAPEFLPHVFERFRQAESTATRSHRGMGLGLAIVKHLVELHGGTVSASSEGENHGSSFTIHLPLAAVDKRGAAEAFAASGNGENKNMLKGLRILLVEDEPDARELIAMLLEGSGASVEAVESAGDALQRLPLFIPDLLLSDIGLPRESGYDLIHKVRSLTSELNKVPAIALTAFASESDRKMSLSAGFQAHLAKPVEPSDLVKTIKRLLNSHPKKPV